MSDIWEPWVPEVGQRVRVRQSAECDYCGGPFEAPDGAVGIVEEVTRPTHGMSRNLQAHRFWLVFEGDPTPPWLDHFAAIELEPAT